MVFRTDVWKVFVTGCISNYDNIKKIWNYDDIMKDSTKYNNDIKGVYNQNQLYQAFIRRKYESYKYN